MAWLIMALGVLGGLALGVQAAINGRLGKGVGVIEAAFVSFLVGTVALGALAFFGRGHLRDALRAPPWQLAGGLLGAFYVGVMVMSTPRIGVTATIACVVTGQMIAAAVLDHRGLILGRQIPFDGHRALALALMGAALFLFYGKR